jgi:hypothetical protein
MGNSLNIPVVCDVLPACIRALRSKTRACAASYRRYATRAGKMWVEWSAGGAAGLAERNPEGLEARSMKHIQACNRCGRKMPLLGDGDVLVTA